MNFVHDSRLIGVVTCEMVVVVVYVSFSSVFCFNFGAVPEK